MTRPSDELTILKHLLSRTLGEIFRVQQRLEIPVPVSDGVIYGLLNGVEEVLDEVLPEEVMTRDVSKAAQDYLDTFERDPVKMSKLQGFYDIERDLEGLGVDRAQAIVLLTYLANDGRFGALIEKMDSQYSPVECKTFEVGEFATGRKDES